LHSRGVKEGDSYGIVMRNSVEFIVAFFALVRLGARAVPVNFLLKADEITFIFKDAGVVGVITQPPFLGNVLEAKKNLTTLRDVVVTGRRREDHPAEPGSNGQLHFDHLLESSQAVKDIPRASDPEQIAMVKGPCSPTTILLPTPSSASPWSRL
jgi:acyl-CoA synthetase (AMP-forming)/AMP-acid ligase II